MFVHVTISRVRTKLYCTATPPAVAVQLATLHPLRRLPTPLSIFTHRSGRALPTSLPPTDPLPLVEPHPLREPHPASDRDIKHRDGITRCRSQ